MTTRKSERRENTKLTNPLRRVPTRRNDSETAATTEVPEVTETPFHLVLVEPPCSLQYRDYPLHDSPLTLGRDPACDIRIDRSDVSRCHAQLTRRGTSWVLRDLDSTNGTFVEDRPISEHTLEAGTRFKIGRCVLLLLEREDPDLALYRRYFREQRHDDVTELPEEVLLEEAVTLLLATKHEPFTLVLLEVDDFQEINAEFGREQGDLVLKEVAQKLRHRLRDTQLYRLAGARFGLIQSGDADISADIEKLLESVKRGIVAAGIEIPIRLSAGICSARASSARALIATATRALVSARRLGGGHVWRESDVGVDRPSFRADVTGEFANSAAYVLYPLRRFQERLKPGASLFAVELEDRQALAVTNARLFERLEHKVERAVRDVIHTYEGDGAVLGEGLNGHPVFVAVDAPAAIAAQLLRDVEKAFAAATRGDGAAQLVSSRIVTVASPLEAIAETTRALGAQQTETRNMLPLPIGHALRLATDARSNEQQFFALIRLHQTITRWLLAVFAAELVRLGPEKTTPFDARLDDILHKPVTDRAWVMLMAAYVDALENVDRDRLALPTYVDTVIANDRDVVRELERFATVRNQFAHGHDVRAPHFYEEWSPRMRALLAGPLAMLGDHPARFVHRVDPIDDAVFDVHFKNLVGDNLAAESTIARRTAPTPVNRIVVEGANGNLLGLSPFAVYLRCPTCHTEEVFFLDQIDRGPVFRSLREGAHTIKKLSDAGIDSRFVEAVMASFDRALVTL